MTGATGKGTYVYDGHGRRVSVVGTDNVNRYQVYGSDGKFMYAGVTTVSAPGIRYIYLNRHLIAEVNGSATTFSHTDALGSPVAKTTNSSTTPSHTHYEPYGKTAGGFVPSIGFTGHVNASDLGLVYMQQRYYDPVAGRFLSTDPVVTDANSGGSFNRYSYATNNPFKYVDPDGRAIETAIDVISLGLSVAAFKSDPSIINGLGVAYDGIATAVPFLPAGFGIVKNAGRVADAVNDMKRGQASEKRVLEAIGETKNTQKVGDDTITIPDFMNSKEVGDIKDTKRVTNTAQLRAQREHATATGRDHVVVTGTQTKVSKTVQEQSTVVRRDDLGPRE